MDIGDDFKLINDVRQAKCHKLIALERVRSLLQSAFTGDENNINVVVSKIFQILGSKKIDARIIVGDLLVSLSVSKINNADIGFSIFKLLISPFNDLDLQSIIFDSMKNIIAVKMDEKLRGIANGSLSACVESVDDPDPFIPTELINFTLKCITDLFGMDDGLRTLPPRRPCIDLCNIAIYAFNIQNSIEDKANSQLKIKNLEITNTTDTSAVCINNWQNILEHLLNVLSQALPFFILYLNSLHEYMQLKKPDSYAILFNDQESRVNPEICSLELLNLIDNIVLTLKKLIICGYLPLPSLRASAIDLLLVLTTFPLYNQLDTQNDSYEAVSDIFIEGIDPDDDPDAYKDFQCFLNSTGQE